MIIDTLDYLLSYKDLLPGLTEGWKTVLSMKEAGTLEVGRYEFEGGYFMVQEGETRPLSTAEFEAHRKYIDVQIVLEGEEVVAYKEMAALTTSVAYDEEKDFELLSGEKDMSFIAKGGSFYIAFPQDGHAPICHIDAPLKYKKIVMKLPVRV